MRLPAALALGLVASLSIAAGCGTGPSNGPSTSTTAGAGAGGAGGSTATGTGGAVAAPPWLADARILVAGGTANTDDCRTGICRHNENTDLTLFQGAIFLVHRTAQSQVLGPNSSLHVYRSTDSGKTFTQTALIPAPVDRDIRDPHFFTVGGKLFIKTLTRLPVNSVRDSDVDTIAMVTSSADGTTWADLAAVGPETWSFWRIKERGGAQYTAAYEDGDKSVSLFSSSDGLTWTKGASVYAVSEDTPLETELTFMPSGKLLALVRMDGTDDELLGDVGRLRTKICWSDPPYASFDCPDELMGQRLDGPLTFFHDARLFVVARKHLAPTGRKRTALFEITGDLEGGKLDIKEWGELPSGGDTSYAGAATIDASRTLVTWYSGDVQKDEAWALAMFDTTDIWQGTIDFSKLK